MTAGERALILGVVTPHGTPGPETEWPLMTAGRIRTSVLRIPAPEGTATDPGTPPTSPSGLRSLATPTALRSATAPAEGSIDALGYASTSTGYVIGHDAEAALVKTLLQTCRVPVESTSTAAVTALRALAVERVALVHPPWFGDELNQMGATYFRDQGFDVTAADVADLPVVAGRIEPTDVIDWITHHLTIDAQAVFFGGNGFRVASAIHRLERQIGRPVLTSNQVLLWSLLGQTCAGIEVPGHGMLFQQTHPPPGQ